MDFTRKDVYEALNILSSGVRETDRLGSSCKQILKQVLDDYFGLYERLKETSLWDVLEYEAKLETPIHILTLDNERLKKENNRLLRKLGLPKKYKTRKADVKEIRVGDLVYSRVLDSVGVVYLIPPEGESILASFVMKNSVSSFSCKPDELELVGRKDDM